MTDEEAVRACDWWTTDVGETRAIGTTSDPMVGLHFGADEYLREPWSNPGKLGWSILVPRFVVRREMNERVENPVYRLIEAEIERRKEKTQ
jgi:hypothetical protein